VFWRRTLVWGLRTFPPPIQRATMPLWSAFFYAQVPHVRRAIESNLSWLLGLSTPRKQLLAFRTFTNYCQSIANAYLPYLGAELDVDVRLSGAEHLRDSLRPDRGVILATGHLGNWQLGPYFLGLHGLPPVTVVMTEEPERGTQQILDELRDKKMRVVYPNRSALLSLDLRATLRRGELVAFQMDRPTAEGGLRVACAGREATFAVGPALLARTCDVPVLPVFFPSEGRKIHIMIEPPLWAPRTRDRQHDLHQLTTLLAEVYERMIRRYPDQWFNFYDFWSAGPP